MGDIFKEQLVKRKSTAKDNLIKAGIILIAVVIGFAIFITPILQSFFIFFIALEAFVLYYVFSFFSIEYEYAFTNGELDIDAIYNKSRRKRLYSGVVKNFEIMAHIDDKDYFNQVQVTKDYSSGIYGANTYAFLTNQGGKKVKIIIEPNDIMLQAFATVLTPRKLIRKK